MGWYGGFHSHGGTPSSLDWVVFFHGKFDIYKLGGWLRSTPYDLGKLHITHGSCMIFFYDIGISCLLESSMIYNLFVSGFKGTKTWRIWCCFWFQRRWPADFPSNDGNPRRPSCLAMIQDYPRLPNKNQACWKIFVGVYNTFQYAKNSFKPVLGIRSCWTWAGSCQFLEPLRYGTAGGFFFVFFFGSQRHYFWCVTKNLYYQTHGG